jgi:hypothetical protein
VIVVGFVRTIEEMVGGVLSTMTDPVRVTELAPEVQALSL